RDFDIVGFSLQYEMAYPSLLWMLDLGGIPVRQAERTGQDPLIVVGGPMMGAAIADLSSPIMKGTTGLVALRETDIGSAEPMPCIRCGHCLDACPVFLNPQMLGKLAMNERYEEMAAHFHLRDCMLCGCCSYVCPSHIPLSQLFAASRAQLQGKKAQIQKAQIQKAQGERAPA
ncbi:MAG: 4Fe-4S dicluster domain-containing protein, partial [Planctomycetota bacterium]